MGQKILINSSLFGKEMNFPCKRDSDCQGASTSLDVGTLLRIVKEEFAYNGYYGHGHRYDV